MLHSILLTVGWIVLGLCAAYLLLVLGIHKFGTRPPMTKAERDKFFGYTRTPQQEQELESMRSRGEL